MPSLLLLLMMLLLRTLWLCSRLLSIAPYHVLFGRLTTPTVAWIPYVVRLCTLHPPLPWFGPFIGCSDADVWPPRCVKCASHQWVEYVCIKHIMLELGNCVGATLLGGGISTSHTPYCVTGLEQSWDRTLLRLWDALPQLQQRAT
jgi:hypothetical protein